MADIFISYARQAQPQAARIAEALVAEGYDVWWDIKLPVHRAYATVIEEKLRAAKAVVVIWSEEGADSEWVRAEADIARSARKLVQIVIDDVTPPLPFNQIECAKLRGWSGDPAAPEWRKVIGSIAQLTALGDRPDSEGRSSPSAARVDKPSIAVLPFQNMSSDPEQEYFADAVTEDVVTALSRWRWFFVIARDSSFQYKGAHVDVRRVGRELGVRYVLEGSVRRVGDRVRVSAQLVEATSGSHIWADGFDRELVDILNLQDEITERIVAAIEPTMLQTESLRVARSPVADLNALDCFQRGMWHFNKNSEEGYHEALALFRKAVTLDPRLSLGYVGLARTLYGGAVERWSSQPMADLKEARDVAQSAIGLDPRDAYGYFASSGASLLLGDHDLAIEEAQKAIALNPNFGFGYFRLGQALLYDGRAQEAIAPIERSLQFSPYDPQLGSILALLALAHYHAKNYAEAIDHAKASLRLNYPGVSLILAASLARLGRLQEAANALPEQLQDSTVNRGPLTARFAKSEDREHWREGLRLARRETGP